MNAAIDGTVRRIRHAGLLRLTRQWIGFLALSPLTGCALMQTTTVEGSKAANDLYAGEPAVVHATEMPVASAEEARQRAAAALAEHDIDLALYLYVQAVSLDPEDVSSLYAIGAIHQERGNMELAARAYARVVELDPGNALAQQGLGIAYFEARDLDNAAQHLHEAVSLDPTLWRAHNALGIIADMNKQYETAIENYTSAIEAQPKLASLRNNRGYSRYLSGRLDAAKQDFLAAIEIDSDYDRAWRNLGLVLAREQDYDGALSAMTHAVDKHIALNDIGYIAMLDGNYAVAQSFLEEAVIVSPRHYQTAQDNLAELQRRRSAQAAVAD